MTRVALPYTSRACMQLLESAQGKTAAPGGLLRGQAQRAQRLLRRMERTGGGGG